MRKCRRNCEKRVFIKINFSFSRFSPFLFVFVGPGLYRKLREVKGFISSKFGPDPTYWGRVMSKNVKSVFINFLNSRFSPFLLVSGGPGPARKLGEACPHIFSEYGPDWCKGVREIVKKRVLLIFLG